MSYGSLSLHFGVVCVASQVLEVARGFGWRALNMWKLIGS